MKITIYDDDLRIVHEQNVKLKINEDGTATATLDWPKPQTTAKQFGEYILKGLSHPDFKEKLVFFSKDYPDIHSDEHTIIGGCALTLGLLGYLNNDLSELKDTIIKIDRSNRDIVWNIAEIMNAPRNLAQSVSDTHWNRTMTATEIANSLIAGEFKLLEKE